jgi:hypothetical protein
MRGIFITFPCLLLIKYPLGSIWMKDCEMGSYQIWSKYWLLYSSRLWESWLNQLKPWRVPKLGPQLFGHLRWNEFVVMEDVLSILLNKLLADDVWSPVFVKEKNQVYLSFELFFLRLNVLVSSSMCVWSYFK